MSRMRFCSCAGIGHGMLVDIIYTDNFARDGRLIAAVFCGGFEMLGLVSFDTRVHLYVPEIDESFVIEFVH